MPTPSAPRPNAQRSEATQAALMGAARRLFVEKGYADTGTPEIVAAAQVTRGALYHHYADKAELFYAVALQAAQEVAAAIDAGSAGAATPLDALMAGAEAYFAAVAQDGRARLLLLDAPAVLTPQRLAQLTEAAGAQALQDGLAQALGGARATLPAPVLAALAGQLSAAFDRAALAMARGAPPGPQHAAMRLLLGQLVRCGPGSQ